ncbi:unnamed protein product [Adineta steineri]|uniref:Uncharacterized protein n=1 Tax=Adineta steineri TaxID=433720 RepID=A0A814JZC8_9BILA|nr:unnamed protein product [Adineta steineri]CAF1045345.1 unnamed protein product [Adineta steineri]CAF3890491.1 unnamed protein product [Adineta steineri]
MATSTMQHSTGLSIISINKKNSFQFLDDISLRAGALFTNPYFIKNITAKVCARVFGEEQDVTEDIEEFSKITSLNLRPQLQLQGLLSFDSYMESDVQSNPYQIHVHGEWNYHAIKASETDPEIYRLHVFLGTIKLLHELFHCLTPSFIEYRNQQRPDLKPLVETPPDMGRKGITNTERKRGGKGIRFIGDMGFAMEEILFNGARLFHHPLSGDFHFLINKLYLQEYESKTCRTTNYDINIMSIWSTFMSSENLFTFQDIKQFSLLKIERPVSPKKTSIFSSPRKISSNSSEDSSPSKQYRHLQSPSIGGIFSDDFNEDDQSDDELENHLLQDLLPQGRKS